MNRSVYLITETQGETRIGSVREILGHDYPQSDFGAGGPGQSLVTVFSDLVNTLRVRGETVVEERMVLRVGGD